MKNIVKILSIFLSATVFTFADNENFDGQDVSGEDFSGGSYKSSSWVGVSAIGTVFSDYQTTGKTSNYSDANFSNADLSDSNFNGANLKNANFTNASLSGSDFRYVVGLTDTQLRSAADITKINLTSKNLSNFNLSGVNLEGATLWFADVKNVDFTNTNLSGANLKESKNLSDVQLRAASNITKVHLGCLTVNRFNLSGLNLNGAIFAVSKLVKTNFSNANLRDADFASTYLYGANFTNANLRDADFRYANLSNADFTNSNLSGANLYGVKNLTDAQLRSASNITNIGLGELDLTNFNLTGLDLSGVTFYSTTLSGADLRGANLTGTKGTPIYKNTIMSDGTIKNFSMSSSEDNFSIRKYAPATAGEAMINAKITNDATISGGAVLTLEEGAVLEVSAGKTLTVSDNGEFVFDVDAATDDTNIILNSGSKLVFGDNSKLTINLTGEVSETDPLHFTVIKAADDSYVLGLDTLPKDNITLSVNGTAYDSSKWGINFDPTTGNLDISVNVPEPATCAVALGGLAIAFAFMRRRR